MPSLCKSFSAEECDMTHSYMSHIQVSHSYIHIRMCVCESFIYSYMNIILCESFIYSYIV